MTKMIEMMDYLSQFGFELEEEEDYVVWVKTFSPSLEMDPNYDSELRVTKHISSDNWTVSLLQDDQMTDICHGNFDVHWVITLAFIITDPDKKYVGLFEL